VFGGPGGFICLMTLGVQFELHRQNSPFEVLFGGYSTLFCGLVMILGLVTLGVRFELHRQNSLFSQILGRFRGL